MKTFDSLPLQRSRTIAAFGRVAVVAAVLVAVAGAASAQPIILGHPQSQTVDPADLVTFTVSVHPMGGPFTYQWRKDGADISGETNQSYAIGSAQESDEASAPGYTVLVSNAGGDTESSAATLTVRDAPVVSGVTIDPPSGLVAVGAPASFTVQLSAGDGPFTYQWYFDDGGGPVALTDGGTISGSQAETLDISAAALSDEGDYSCEVSNWATDTSGPATLLVGGDILTFDPAYPEDIKRYLDETASFTVVVNDGVPPLSYQWYDDSKALIPDATDATFAIDPVAGDDAGAYECEVTDQRDTYTSPSATLEVGEALAITADPVGGEYITEESHTFSVETTGGFPPLMYQWQKDGEDVGPDSSEFALTDLVVSDSGGYTVTVSDGNTMVLTSGAATLTVETGVPAAGLAALGLLAGACVLGGALVIRRK